MKIITVTILLTLFILDPAFSSVFTELNSETNELNGNTNKLTGYFDLVSEAWKLSDRIYIKYNPSDKPFYDTYSNSYLKNNIRVSRSGIIGVSTWLSTEVYSDDNIPTGFIGTDGDYTQKNSVSSGIDIAWSNSQFSLNIGNKFLGRSYTCEEPLSEESKDEFESDIILSGSLILNSSDTWHPFAEFYHFNDMNENNFLSYSDYSAGAEYKNLFDRILLVGQKFSAGYTDLYPGIPYYLLSDTRLTANIGQKWTILSKLYFSLFADENFSSLYNGNNFSEILIQRNFPVDQDNYYLRIRTGLIFNPGDKSLVWKSAFVYPFRNTELSGEYKLYPGDKNPSFKEHYINAGFLMYFHDKRIQAGYNIGYILFRTDYSGFIGHDTDTTHKIIINFNL